MRMKILATLALAVAGWALATLPIAADANAAEVANPAPKVIMYATSTCTYCIKARAWFSGRNIAWDERDVETSAAANKEWKQLGGVGTPLIVINGKPIHGFDEPRIVAELDQTKKPKAI